MAGLRNILESDQYVCGVELVTTRGTIDEAKAVLTRTFARELVDDPRIDWMSITGNAGGDIDHES